MPNNSLSTMFVYGVVILASLYVVGNHIQYWCDASNHLKAVKGWSTTTGTITDSEFDYHHLYRHSYYQSWIKYKYIIPSKGTSPIEGLSYMPGTSREEAQHAVKTFPIGTKIPVFYNPEKVDQSETELGILFYKNQVNEPFSAMSVATMILVGIFLVLGIGFSRRTASLKSNDIVSGHGGATNDW